MPSASTAFGPYNLCPGDRAILAVIQVEGKSVLVVRQTVPAAGLQAFLPQAQAFLSSLGFDPGAARAPAPRTLVVGSADPSYDDEVYFAQKVAALSHGMLQVSLQSELYGGVANNEELVVRDLERGKLDLAWDPDLRLGQEGSHELRGTPGTVLDRRASGVSARAGEPCCT